MKCPEVQPPTSLAPIIMKDPAKKHRNKRETNKLFRCFSQVEFNTDTVPQG